MVDSARNIAIVCNPTADNAKALYVGDAIAVFLTGMGTRFSLFTQLWPTVWDNFTEAWIVGGDGTLNCFINQNPEFDLPMAIFAGGSGNDFHWMLYGVTSVEVQVERVLQSQPRPVDAGVCNGRYFLNGLGIGFDGAIVHDLEGRKKLAGKASYLLSILKNIVSFHEKNFMIRSEQLTIDRECFLISVANTKRYGGGFMVAPRAIVDDGLLDLNVVGRISPFNRVRYLPVVEKGEHLELPFVEYQQLTQVSIECDANVPAHVDGEYFTDRSFDVQILPKRFSFLY